MVRVLCGVPIHKPLESFITSLHSFMRLAPKKYDISFVTVFGRSLVDAQNLIAKQFLEGGYQYLLLLEDDNSGFTVEMLDALLKPNTHIVGMKYWSRHFIHHNTLMKRWRWMDDHWGHRGFNAPRRTGYCKVDLCGFGMTLIRRDVFSILKEPYFRKNVYHKRGFGTDQDFCSRLIDKGIHPLGCFDHCLTHGDINDSNVNSKRLEWMMNNKQIDGMGLSDAQKKRAWEIAINNLVKEDWNE